MEKRKNKSCVAKTPMKKSVKAALGAEQMIHPTDDSMAQSGETQNLTKAATMGKKSIKAIGYYSFVPEEFDDLRKTTKTQTALKMEIEDEIRAYCAEEGLELIEPIACDVVSYPQKSSIGVNGSAKAANAKSSKDQKDEGALGCITPFELALRWLEIGEGASRDFLLDTENWPAQKGPFTCIDRHGNSFGHSFSPMGGAFFGPWIKNLPEMESLVIEAKRIEAIKTGHYDANQEAKGNALREIKKKIAPLRRIRSIVDCLNKGKERLAQLEKSEPEPFKEGQRQKERHIAQLRSMIQAHEEMFAHGSEIIKAHYPALHRALRMLEKGTVTTIVSPDYYSLLSAGVIVGKQLADWIGDCGYDIRILSEIRRYREYSEQFDLEEKERTEHNQKEREDYNREIMGWEAIYEQARERNWKLPVEIPLPDGRKIHLEITECIRWWHGNDPVVDRLSGTSLNDANLREHLERTWFQNIARYLNVLLLEANDIERIFALHSGGMNYIKETVARLLDIEKRIGQREPYLLRAIQTDLRVSAIMERLDLPTGGENWRVKDSANPFYLLCEYFTDPEWRRERQREQELAARERKAKYRRQEQGKGQKDGTPGASPHARADKSVRKKRTNYSWKDEKRQYKRYLHDHKPKPQSINHFIRTEIEGQTSDRMSYKERENLKWALDKFRKKYIEDHPGTLEK
ncbi:MAG: hypothetical protein NTX50_30845 [Candidatus Sumerlaeota bacterium]|nr:hypothetical protein [Candidatus Sumerlaeota bacterium]